MHRLIYALPVVAVVYVVYKVAVALLALPVRTLPVF
jgi:hypothetical protein